MPVFIDFNYDLILLFRNFRFNFRRHVLRIMIQAPIGYHVDICSQTSFVFGEEDVVMQNLTKVIGGFCD